MSGTQFLLQIILARLLEPQHYGMLSIMIIFTSLANVFIQTGFNTSLIQSKDVREEDYSSVFWISVGIAVILYGVIFATAPFIATFYEMPELVAPLRVISLILFPGALNSIQLAKVSRELDFKKVFFSNIGAAVVSGIVGIVIAYLGGGLWALVAQSVLNVLIVCLVMMVSVNIKIQFICDLKRVKELFEFGWKILVSSLLDTLYQDLRSLVIGKKYDSGTLGYYNRGKQFPQFIINAVNGAVQSVMLPVMSKEQDDRTQLKNIMRTSISVSAYIIFPMMAGLAGVAEPVVQLLLTDKWLPCVPYLQIYCFTFAFYPVHSCNLQAINAMGRSDIFLRLEIIKKLYGIAVLSIAVFCFDSPIAIAMTGVVTAWIGWFVNAHPNKKLLNYSYIDQIKDLLPQMLMTIIMCVAVLLVGKLECGTLITLIVQVIVGIIVYLLLSIVFKPMPYRMIVAQMKNMRVRK